MKRKIKLDKKKRDKQIDEKMKAGI